jgi:hypothetical protein
MELIIRPSTGKKAPAQICFLRKIGFRIAKQSSIAAVANGCAPLK